MNKQYRKKETAKAAARPNEKECQLRISARKSKDIKLALLEQEDNEILQLRAAADRARRGAENAEAILATVIRSKVDSQPKVMNEKGSTEADKKKLRRLQMEYAQLTTSSLPQLLDSEKEGEPSENDTIYVV
jgi:hypothetical protein